MRPIAGLVSTATRLRVLAGLDPAGCLDLIGNAYRNRPLLFPATPLGYPGFDGDRLTGRQLAELTRRIAEVLLGLGVRANTRVVVCRRNHPDYLVHMHAVIAAGGIPVSVNAATGWPFLTAVVDHTNAALILTDSATVAGADDATLARLHERAVTVCLVDPATGAAVPESAVALGPLVDKASGALPTHRRVGDDTVLAVFHTSGTTGTPKLCVWTAANTRRIWKIMAATLPVGAHSRLLLAVPYSHALFFALGTGVLLCGAAIHTPSTLEPDTFLAAIDECRATGVFAFPHLYMRAAARGFDGYDLGSVKIWSTGADKVHAAHIAPLIGRGGLRLAPWRPRGSVFLDSYGSTEIGAGGIMQLWFPGSVPQPCLQGRPMPTQFAYRIVDESWRDLPAGQEGRILVRSATAFAGYWNDHERWAENRIDGWWWAGDVGRRDKRGRLEFLDREQDSVHTRDGVLRTLPVEERLLAHPAVMEAAVFQAGHLEDGTGVAVALVALRNVLTRADLAGSGLDLPATQDELRTWANRDRPGPPLAAVRVVAMEEIPLGVTGKVLKTRLRDSAQTGALRFDDVTGVPA
ncbi:MAG TPA: class I adenylate-forming enzyme family protein [Micromonosporaceae bacterium]|jgi:acyl-coenzyme A synthetase/AMP-(fatty) acid ligase|nr:class I adenylate-forming enzyme family protein [Micromonosporaceae bacterium]